ncbi:SpaA isopeptide-forming pilin-related protein [Clostridium chrysemydis]|uniref:SpaA isopeptide-forming pilin-related protein n=1 Tax=Clostridium chrysemydis TaxID=2665504 RepID=UPI00188415A5|nr:SpaA isopeptide-forming pilin-related protein [Clostridium chrysemydis]
MSNKRKRFFRNLSIVITLSFLVSLLFPNVVANAASNNIKDNLEISITSNKDKVESGRQIEFKLEYRVTGGQGSLKEGDILEFELPDDFTDIKPSYPKEHFKEVTVSGNTVKAVFGKGAETALAGYLTIKANAKDVDKPKDEKVTVNVSGIVKTLDVQIVPDPNKGGSGGATDRQLIKSVDGAFSYEDGKLLANISKPALGKVQKYTVYVNEKYDTMYDAVFSDKLPDGSVLLKDSIKIFEEPNGGQSRDVTSEFRNRTAPGVDTLNINFGTTNNKYRIQYSTRYTKELDKYINTSYLTQYNKPKIESSTIVRPTEKDDMISKGYTSDNRVENEDGTNSYYVSNTGDIVNYKISVNPNNGNMKNAVLEDVFPKGMEIVKNSLSIYQIDENGNFSWVTDNFKDKTKIENGKLTIDFGNSDKNYTVNYKLKVIDRYKEYKNDATITYSGKNQESDATISYERNAGAINAKKLVDKTEILKGDDQIVTYTIDFDCFGYFNQNYLKIEDNLDSRVKILDIEVPKEFTASTSGNKITVVNDKGSIEYGADLSIKIKVDFSKVPNGTTIENVAKIDKTNTNKVQTKKGYAFSFKKVDSLTKAPLSRAKFEVLDKDKNIIKTLVSDENGVVKGDLDSYGDYYLKEVEAPNGYNLDNKEVSFKVGSSDIGTILELKDVENSIKTGSVTLTKEDSITKKPLKGASFKLYNDKDEVINTSETDENGKINLDNLRPGKYYFKESTAPKGYNISNDKYNFEIIKDQVDKRIEVLALNDVKLGKVTLTKEDKETNERLEGAIFDLFKINDDSKEVKIGSFTSDKNGEIKVSNLVPGNYYFIETKAPSGYELSNIKNNFTITLGETDKVSNLVVKNDILKNEIVLVKLDDYTNKPLKGAKYGLYDSNNKLIKEVTTNENGEGIINERLRTGSYYFKEISAPVGYKISDEKLVFNIDSKNNVDKSRLVAKDSVILSSAKLIKVDEETEEKLEGAVYGLYDSSDKLIEKVTTDKNGEGVTGKVLRPGSYYFKEITPPKGYYLNNLKYKFDINLQDTDKIKVINAKDFIVTSSLKVTKVDSETKEKLEGAIFELYKDNDLIGSLKTGKDGTLTFDNLRPGNYYVVEKVSPKMYELDSSKHSFKVELSNSKKEMNLEIKNNIKKGNISFVKEDYNTLEKLEGAIYGLYDSNDNLIEEAKSNSLGKGEFTSKLRPGDYYIKEIKAPKGYNLNAEKVQFKIDLDNLNKEIVVKDSVILSSVKLTKIDSETSDKIQGAKYGLYDSNDNLISTVITGKDGEVTTNKILRPGDYYFKEIEAPEGYNLNTIKYPFKIILGEDKTIQNVVAKDDIILGSVTLTKIDSETLSKLEGAKFKLFNNLGEISEYTTDENGNIKVDNLRPGNYYFIETEAPKGYELDNSKHEFNIELKDSDKPIFIQAKNNIKKCQVKLIKKDSFNGTNLEGAIYGLYDEKDNLIQEVTTLKNGEGLIKEKLRPGKYYFKEIQAPKGYKKDDEKLFFDITFDDLGETKIITAKNDPIVENDKTKIIDENKNPKPNTEKETKDVKHNNKPSTKEVKVVEGKVVGENKKYSKVIDNKVKDIKEDKPKNIVEILPKTGYENKYICLGLGSIIIGIFMLLKRRRA